MAKAEWGEKRTCPSCGVQFYDLRRKKIVCPKCDSPYEGAPAAKAKHAPAPASEPETADVVAIETLLEDVDPATAGTVVEDMDEVAVVKDKPVDVGEDDAEPENAKAKSEDDELIEDASDLGEDDDDMSEVKEHIDDGVEDRS